MSTTTSSEAGDPLVAAIVVKEATATAPALCSISAFNKRTKRITICEFSDTSQLPTAESILLQLQPTELSAYSFGNKGLASQLVEIVSQCCPQVAVQILTTGGTADEGVIESDLARLLLKTDASYTPSHEWLSSDVSKRSFLILTNQYRILCNSGNFNACTLAVESADGIFMKLDRATFNALNLFPPTFGQSGVSANGGSATTSLYGLLNKCKTRMGSRRLQQWIRQPLVDAKLIAERHDVVEALVNSARVRQLVQGTRLSRVPDLDLIGSKFRQAADEKASNITLEDLVKVYEGVVAVNCLVDDLKALANPTVERTTTGPLEASVRNIEGFMRLVETTLDLTAASRGDYRIDAKFDPALGELSAKRDEILNEMDKLRAAVARSVDNVKIADCPAPHYMAFRVSRKQMPAVQGSKYKQVQINKAEYLFTNSGLMDLVSDLRSVETEYAKKSASVVKKIASVASTYHRVVGELGDLIGSVDVLTSFAVASAICRLTRPVLVDTPADPTNPLGQLSLKRCRHLLVEVRSAEVMGSDYIANSVSMNGADGNMQIITGPNMGGKSTYIRSVALSVLMNQIGCFVPCDSGSELPVFNSIMCRVGASDAQVRGVSTFMEEMIEAATIVNSANNRSLVIIDELGRGTSTQDGLGLAWSISKYLKDVAGSFVLFATHFHELSQLPGAVNRHVAALVNEKGLTLLYEVRDGPTSNSFGPNVAALAGYPPDVVQDAIAREKQLVHESGRMDIDEGVRG